MTTLPAEKSKSIFQDPAVRTGVGIFLVLRLFLTGWAILVLTIIPLPSEPDEVERPYLGLPVLAEGPAGTLLGPWQRHDVMRYLRIATSGYEDEANSVFPPLYPLLVRALAFPVGGSHSAQMATAVIISNLACLGLLILFHKVAAYELGPDQANRTVVYFALFPTAFFLFAPYTESLFLLLALASLWSARQRNFGWAGLFGFLASLTRLTGWVLVVPLAYEFWRSRLGYGKWKIEPGSMNLKVVLEGMAVLLPGFGTFLFLVYRYLIGLPALGRIYADYWWQETGFPGFDLIRALQTMFLGGEARMGEFTLWFDFFCAILLLVTTIIALRKLRLSWGLYAALLLFFMLLPTSELKPLYSFSRYALAFFPTFLLLGKWGQNGWVHRAILYPSIILYLYFSGQFFLWGWVA